MVTIYTKPGCVQCNATKRKAEEKGIPFVMVDVTEDADAMALVKELGYLQVPVVTTESGEHWSGYRPDLLDSLAASVV